MQLNLSQTDFSKLCGVTLASWNYWKKRGLVPAYKFYFFKYMLLKEACDNFVSTVAIVRNDAELDIIED